MRPMDVKTWTTISRLLDHALDLPASARPAWIETLGAEHEALKPQLRARLAQPDSRGYRLRKFVTPHRVGVVAASVSLVAVLAGAGGAVWQAGGARREQRRAGRSSRSSSPPPGTTPIPMRRTPGQWQ
jgi:hypothetical protein